MSHSLIGTDRTTHLKILAVALAGAILVVIVGITARVNDIGVASAQTIVVKAGRPATFTATHTTAIR